MITRITSTPKDYAWGSPTALQELLGTPIDGRPQAELWLGAHPSTATRIVGAGPGMPATLNEWLVDNDAGRLPFLLKLLAAEQPLSLQAHPTLERARASFAEEESSGLPIDHPERNYKDPWHKPELIVALLDGFEALCGFRREASSVDFLSALADVAEPEVGQRILGLIRHIDDQGLAKTVSALLGERKPELVAALVCAAEAVPEHGRWSREAALLVRLQDVHPGDPGIVVAALMNFVTLRAGEGLFLAAGNIHAYVRGLGVEVMAASDNVLRGGLTTKHIDVPELLSVLDFTPIDPPLVLATRHADLDEYGVPVPDFALLRFRGADGPAVLDVRDPAIVVAVEGSVIVGRGPEEIVLEPGQAAFIAPGQEAPELSGTGTAFVATGRASE
jgi:mannose-6-phosphate isomerase